MKVLMYLIFPEEMEAAVLTKQKEKKRKMGQLTSTSIKNRQVF